MTEPTTAEKRRIAAIGRVRKLIDQKVREGYAYQWWIDLDGPRLLAIVETVLDAKPDGGQRD